MASGAAELVLSASPEDSISTVKFGASGHLLASSWDKSVRLYDIKKDVELCKYSHQASVLTCCFDTDSSHSFSGGLDEDLITCDLATQKTEIIGAHNNPIQSVEYSSERNLVFTGSWDKTMKAWDPRSNTSEVSSQELNGKVYSMSLRTNKLVIGTSERQIYIFDVRNLGQPAEVRESPLKHVIRCVKCHPDGSGYIVTSIEGRVAVEYFEQSMQAKKFAFKCHRQTDQDGLQTVFPVNCVAFHPIYHTFATGGCDGVINIWDGNSKKRISQFEKYRMGISTMDFSPDGKELALAVSYTWEVGDVPHDPDKIYIRQIRTPEVQPKAKRR